MINHIGDTIIVQHNWKYLQIFWIMKYIINTYAVANNWSRQWRGNLSLRVKITWKSKSLYFHWDFTTWCNATKTFEYFKTYTNSWKYHQNYFKSIPLLYTLWKCLWKAFSCSLPQWWPFENAMNLATSVVMYGYRVYLDSTELSKSSSISAVNPLQSVAYVWSFICFLYHTGKHWHWHACEPVPVLAKGRVY